MKKADYMKLYNADLDEIRLTDDDIRDWLDAIVDGMKAVQNASYMLTWGVFDEDRGEYENTIEPCGDITRNWGSYHIYQGLEKAAAAVGMGVSVEDRNDKDYPYEYYFVYRGIRFYQLGRTEEKP